MPDIVRVGGQQYSWNSTLSRIDGAPWRGITGVEWSEKLEVETIYDQDQTGVPIGDTAGQYSATLSLKWLWEYFEQFKTYLSLVAIGDPPGNRGPPGSYGQTRFKYQLSASEPLQLGAAPIMLTANNCRLIEAKGSPAKGQAGLEIDVTLWVRTLIINGLTMYSPPIPSF